METCRPCGCKGIRTCLLCEKLYDIKKDITIDKKNESYVYCPFCNKCFNGWEVHFKDDCQHNGRSFEFPGIYIEQNFLNQDEEQRLLNAIDRIPWQLSQSGRRKQNFGPKCNFNKCKLQLGDFKGFPASTKFVQEKFSSVNILKEFQTIEQCTLEYDPKRGASIDPHIDDCWIWGERIVTVNLLSDSVLTMTYNRKPTKYNLNHVHTYPSILNENGLFCIEKRKYILQQNTKNVWPVVRIPMPKRSLLVMYGAARYEWEHQILREDILEKRICLAYREFTPPYLEHGDNFNYGKSILNIAQLFF